MANHSTEETICTRGWLASYLYLPYFTGRINFKMVVRDLLISSFWNHYQTFQAPEMSTVLGEPICANKSQPRSTWRKFTNGRPPFWFNRESIWISDGECTYTMAIRTCNGRFVGQARVDSSFHTRHTNAQKLSTAKWHTMYGHAIYPNVYPQTSFRELPGNCAVVSPKPNCQAASPDDLICGYVTIS